MEALSSIAIVGLIVIGIVDAIKKQWPDVQGFVTILVAALLGALWALVDAELGFTPDLSIAQGISAGLVASGAVGLAKKI